MALKLRNWWKRHFATGSRRKKAWSFYFERRAARHGLCVYKSHVYWLRPGRFQDAVARWGDVPGVPLDRCFLLFSLAEHIGRAGVPGAMADCGVRFGKSSHFMLEGARDGARPHHLFDSFEGLSEPSGLDVVADAGLGAGWAKGDLAVPEAVARDKLARFPHCHFHKGWIPGVFAGLDESGFALVHVDVDLYEPTKACFEFFYERMSRGGLMVCDDYGFASTPGATRAMDEFFADKPEKPISIPSGQGMIIKT